MKKLFLTMAICMATIAYLDAATVTWDGGAGTSNWMDTDNWSSNALPTSSDDVVIDGYTVSLDISTTIQRVTVLGSGELTIMTGIILNVEGFTRNDDGIEVNNSATIINNGTLNISNITGGSNADGLYVRGIFTNNGVINIDGTGDHGLYVQRGNFTNNVGAILTITNISQIASDGDGLYVDDSSGVLGSVTNYGSITVTMTSGDDGLYVNDGTSFDNHGIVSISGNGDNGIRVDDSFFDNKSGATFEVTGQVDDQLYLDNTSSFINSGTINLTGSDSDDAGLYVIDNSTFTNMMGGVVNINNSLQFAIQIDANSGTAEIINNGVMNASASVNDGLRLQEDGLFTNNNGGILNILTAGDVGIIYENVGTLTNNGILNVSNSVGHGMEMTAGAIFNNTLGATFNITNSSKKGILMESGTTVNNSGLIEIDASTEEGIDMIDGTFNNNAGGVYRATNIVDDGLEINGPAILNNDGLLDIDGSGSEDIETFYGPSGEAPTINNTGNAEFRPGSSPGDLEIKGDFYLGASTVVFEINGLTGTSDFDQILNSSSTNFIDLGTATAHLDWGSYVPVVGDKFKIIDGSGMTIGSFASVTSSNSTLGYTVTNLGAEIEVEITAILPVELLSFAGKKSSRGTQLSWQTASEINNDGFEIERSINGFNWTRIGYVKGEGTSHSIVDYSYLDNSPINGINYYRLKQNDLDGKFEYSNIITVNFKKENRDFTLYPNPVKDVLFIDMDSELENVEVNLYDSNGQVVWMNKGFVTQIPFENFTHGVYFLEIVSPVNKTIQKIIK